MFEFVLFFLYITFLCVIYIYNRYNVKYKDVERWTYICLWVKSILIRWLWVNISMNHELLTQSRDKRITHVEIYAVWITSFSFKTITDANLNMQWLSCNWIGHRAQSFNIPHITLKLLLREQRRFSLFIFYKTKY